MKVIIIGSGLSGLTAGAVLAQAGHEVAIFEQYHQVGASLCSSSGTASTGTSASF